MAQTTEAAQRSAHVRRDAPAAEPQDARPAYWVTIRHPSGESRSWHIRTDVGPEGWALEVAAVPAS